LEAGERMNSSICRW